MPTIEVGFAPPWRSAMKRLAVFALATLLPAGMAAAQDMPFTFAKTAPVLKGVAAFPRLSGSGDIVQKINKALGQGDQRAKKAAKVRRTTSLSQTASLMLRGFIAFFSCLSRSNSRVIHSRSSSDNHRASLGQSVR